MRGKYRYARRSTAVMCFKRQLHITVVIVITDVFAGIMHAQETPETDGMIQFAVFDKMLHQAGKLYQLVQFGGGEKINRQKGYDDQLSQYCKITKACAPEQTAVLAILCIFPKLPIL